MPFHARFEINIIAALSGQLLAALDDLMPAALNDANNYEVGTEQGVYALYHRDILVYVGKADNLQSRLRQHAYKISGRHNISLNDMSFKCLYVHQNWTALAPEVSLIKHYKAQNSGACAWNGNGFGPHDPGRNREVTNKPADGFDQQYPIIEDIPCTWIQHGDWNVLYLLIALKDNLPFLLRYEVESHYRSGHQDYNNVMVYVPTAGMSAKALLKIIVDALPGWQATVFPSHMILYPESRVYTHGVTL